MNNMIVFNILNPEKVAIADCSEGQGSEIVAGFDAGGISRKSRIKFASYRGSGQI